MRDRNPMVQDREPLPEIKEMQDEASMWLIEWTDSSVRTGVVGMAWYAKHFDDEATVTPIER